MVTRSTALANVFDHFDRTLFTPYAVGFDRVFDRLQEVEGVSRSASTGFPPYNIRKDGDYNFVIEIALAGLSKDDLEVEVAEGVLTVRTKKRRTKMVVNFCIEVFHIVSLLVSGRWLMTSL